jgi:hypothetical protein
VRPSRPLRQLLRHPSARWGGALLAVILVVAQILLLQHRMEHVDGSPAHCDVCVAGKALGNAATAAALTPPACGGTDVPAVFEARSAIRADALPPRARGPPTAPTA